MAKYSIFLILSLAASALALYGCGREVAEKTSKSPVTNSKSQRTIHTVGEVGEVGRLATWASKRGSSDVPFLLDDDYGVTLINEGSEKQPRALYVLGSRGKKKVWQTHNINKFQQLVDSIPKEAKVRIYDSCAVSIENGLTKVVMNLYDKTLKRLKVKNDDRNITCICASPG